MTLLLESSQVDELDTWKKEAYHSFKSKITDRQMKFPCIPATTGFQLNQFRFGFTGDPSYANTHYEVASLLKEYGKIYRTIGKYTSLIIFFQFTHDNSLEVENYEAIFWNMLNRVSELDYRPWPLEIPEDPENPLWEFCYGCERYFLYTATPSHKKRQSRSFPYFMLAITPRWVFNQFEQLSSSKKVKSKIRERLKEYDAIDTHPALKLYGQPDNFEAHQYFLRDNQTTLSKCPFHKKTD